MKAGSVKSGYQDPLALKKRRVFMIKIVSGAGLSLAAIAGIIYLLFFSGFLKINEITVDGVADEQKELVENFVKEKIDGKFLLFIPAGSNIVFFDAGDTSDELLQKFPEFKNADFTKEMPHCLKINIKERVALGIWCFNSDADQKCVYFDEESKTWGSPTSSSGFLLVRVDDPKNRITAESEIMKTIIAIIEELKNYLKVKNIDIPEDNSADFKVYIDRGYYLHFSFDSDIQKQVRALKLFLAEKEGDFTFQPQYIDLRIEDRIYWR